MSKISVAIVGLGRAGWGLHLQPMLKHGGFDIVVVADPLEERRREAEALTGCRSFTTINELLQNSPATLVVVATPSATHYQDALRVLKSGRHCLLEKPIAMNARDADELVALAQQLNLRLFVNHAHLHRKEFHHLKGVIESGILGPIFHIRTFWGNYARRWDWQTLKKNGGGQLNNTCPHALSMVLPLLDSPVTNVYADLQHIKDAGDAEDHVHLMLKTAHGVTADVVVSSAMALGGPRWLICGKYGTLSSDGKMSRVRYYDPAKAPEMSLLDEAAPGRQYSKEQLPWEEREIEVASAAVSSFHENVFDVLTADATQVVTPESAAEVVRVSGLAQKAAQN